MTNDPKKLHELEQALALMREVNLHGPRLWKELYDKCIEEGFNPVDALTLVKTHILAQCPFGVRMS